MWLCKSTPQVLLSLPKEHRSLYNYSHSPSSLPQTHFDVSRDLLYHDRKHWQFWQEMLERAGAAPYLMGMLLRVHVISGSGYDSTTQINLAMSSTSASTVSRGVLIKGAERRKRKWENLPVPPRERHKAWQTPLAEAAVSLQGHSMAFSPALRCLAHPPCVRCNTGLSAFVAAASCCLLQVLQFPLCSFYRVQNQSNPSVVQLQQAQCVPCF